ncbi:MAG: hypothetical protein ACI9NT_001627, partial [Bacteroidia bacterium]
MVAVSTSNKGDPVIEYPPSVLHGCGVGGKIRPASLIGPMIEGYGTLTDRKRERPADYFSDWKEREALAEGMIPLVGRLAREKSVKCYIYGRSLVNQSVLQIM